MELLGGLEWNEEEVVPCAGCDGNGFQIVMYSQWEEDELSPATCFYCAGLGFVEG